MDRLVGLLRSIPLSHRRGLIFSTITLTLIISLIYGNTFDSSWHFDDIPNITENVNLHLGVLSWNRISAALYSDQRNPQALYRPVACLSFALNYYFGGLHVFGYHLVNTIVHIVASVFLFLFIYHTLNLPRLKFLRTKYTSSSFSIAILATILWAINPVHTQAITYIVQRMASMAGMFYIMSMYFYLKARTAKERGKSLVFLMLCFVSFLMAFGSKENAAMIPLSLLLYEIILMETDPSKFLRSHIGVFFMILGAGLVASSSYLFFKNESLSSFLRGYGERPFTLTQRLLTEPRIIIFYITLLLYPIPNRFSVAHSIQISSNLFNPPWTFFASLTVVGAIVYLIYGARKHPLFSFCYLFFFLNHVIESSIFPLELIFEHRNYVPSMLFFLPIAVGILRLLNRYGEKRAMRYVISSSLVLILIGLGHSTGMRNLVWKNEERLWSDALEKATDQVRVHHNLGVYYQDRGDRAQAISEFQKALQSPVVHEKDEKIITYYHLGKIYNEAGDYERAKSFYLEALRIRPDFSYALGGLVSIYDKEGQGGLADRYLKKALDSNPADPYINFNMGLYSLKRGMPDKAIGYFMISMKEDGLRARALLYMGIAHKQGGRLGEAVLCLRKSASMDSHNITPHLQLAESLLKSGNEKMGREEVKTALRMMGHQKDLFYQTVDLISKRGHFEEVQLSAELILPIMNEVLQKDSIGPKRWATYLNKTLQRRMALQ